MKKKCSKCDKEKELKYFSFRKDTQKYRGACRSCSKGYKRLLSDKQEELLKGIDEGVKECGKCKKVKDLSEYHADKSTVSGLTSWCITCKKEYTKDNKENIKITRASKIYNISKKEASDLLSLSNCEICNKEIEGHSKHIDHCHESGLVRGILCRECNLGLGHFKDDILNLGNAIAYLSKNK